MIYIEKTTINNHAILCIQDFSSLLSSGTQAPLHIFHWLLEDDFLAMAMLSQQAAGTNHISGVCAFQPLVHTPPPGR